MAEAEVEELAEKIDLMDAGMTSMEQASKIVHQFLIPEVIKREKGRVYNLDGVLHYFKRRNFIKREKRFYWLLNLFCLNPKNKILKFQNRKNNRNNKMQTINLKIPIFINQIYFYNNISNFCVNLWCLKCVD